MTPEVEFLLSFLVTVAILVAVLVTGMRAQRRRHLTLVATFFTSLGITIFFAERLGDGLDLEAAGLITPVHLTLAKTTTLAYLLPVSTGIATLRNPAWRRRHRKLAFAVFAMTLLTVVTGVWMVWAAKAAMAAAV
ncbi:MAG: hypothetical protein AAF682_14655 [Planctomycetota bacterium]